MNRSAVWAIARKDMRAVTANIQVWLPMLIVPIMFGVVLPLILVWSMQAAGNGASQDMQEVLRWLDKLPSSSLKETLATLSDAQKVIYLVSNYMLAPFFLIIPLMVSSVITADSFAGEKERGTLESLLFTPVDLRSLLTGKVLASLLPSLGLSFLTFLLCGAVINAAGWQLFGRIFFPQSNWIPLMLLVIPSISLAAILVNVFISARVSSFQAAYQMGGLVIIPVLLLLVGQATGLLMLDALVITVVGIVLILLDALLLRIILRSLDRGRLFESQIR